MHGFDSLCDALAGVLTYPGRDYAERVLRFRDLAAIETPAAVEEAETFMSNIEGKSLSELEELYIKTFDLNPLCSLDTGWQLFGEEYHRGLYMVRMREEMRKHGIPETSELPDHLTNVFPVLGRMTEEDAISFAVCCVIPAVNKVLEAVKQDNPYRPLVQGMVNLLDARYGQYVEEAVEESPIYSTVFASEEANHE